MNKIESINLIYRNPSIRGGRPCIVGTSLRVIDIVMAMTFAERAPDQLAQDYDLSMAEVHAALAYYYCNKDEIDEDIREHIRRSEELAKKVFGDKSSFSSRLRPYMRDDDFRAAILEAIEASNESRPALVKALFAKMDALFATGSSRQQFTDIARSRSLR